MNCEEQIHSLQPAVMLTILILAFAFVYVCLRFFIFYYRNWHVNILYCIVLYCIVLYVVASRLQSPQVMPVSASFWLREVIFKDTQFDV